MHDLARLLNGQALAVAKQALQVLAGEEVHDEIVAGFALVDLSDFYESGVLQLIVNFDLLVHEFIFLDTFGRKILKGLFVPYEEHFGGTSPPEDLERSVEVLHLGEEELACQ